MMSRPCMRACVVVPLLSSSEPFALPPSLLPSPLEPLPAHPNSLYHILLRQYCIQLDPRRMNGKRTSK